MTENREPRFLHPEERDKLAATVSSLQHLIKELENGKWEIKEDYIDWITTDMSHLQQVYEKMEYTYYVE